jgi:hypothetical protein
MPAATHTVPEEHDIEERRFTNGSSNVTHVVPLLVPTIAGLPLMSPVATQVTILGQETLTSESVPAGGVWEFQVAPSVVLTILNPSTAVHSMIVTHEIDCAGNDAS